MDRAVGIVSRNLVELEELRRIPRQSVFHAFRDRMCQSWGAIWHLNCGQVEARCLTFRLHEGGGTCWWHVGHMA